MAGEFATNALGTEEASSSSRAAPCGHHPALWDIRDIQFHCRISRATAWRLVRSEGFPAPVVLGAKTVRWRRIEVEGFLEDRHEPSRYQAGTARRARELAPYVSRAVRGH